MCDDLARGGFTDGGAPGGAPRPGRLARPVRPVLAGLVDRQANRAEGAGRADDGAQCLPGTRPAVARPELPAPRRPVHGGAGAARAAPALRARSGPPAVGPGVAGPT